MVFSSSLIRVLYTEDNLFDADQTKTHFAQYASEFQLEIVGTSQDCLEHLRNEQYDMLLLVQHLPAIDGLNILQILNQKGLKVPVIFVTEDGDDDLAVKALRLGAINYGSKTAGYLGSLPGLLLGALDEHNQKLTLPKNSQEHTILYVGNDKNDMELTLNYFAENAPHFITEIAQTNAEALERLKTPHNFELVLIEQHLPHESGLKFAHEIKRQRMSIPPFIIISDQGDDAIAIATLKLSTADYITKNNGYLARLVFSVEQAIAHEKIKRINDQLQSELSERKRVEEKLLRRANEFAALYETTSDLAGKQDLQTLLNTIVERVMRLLSAPYGSIDLYDPGQGDLVLAVSKGYANSLIGTRINMGQGMAGRVAQSRLPMIVDDYQTWEHCLPGYAALPFGSFCQVPLQYGGELIGILSLAEIKPSTRIFTEADVNFMSLLAGQAASAVYDARLYEETHHRLVELEAVNKISTALRAAHSVDEILPLLMDEMLAVLGTNSGMLWLYNSVDDKISRVITRGWFTPLGDANQIVIQGIPRQVLDTGKEFITREFISDPRVQGEISPQFPSGWGGVVVPILNAEESIGLIFMAVPLPREINPGDVRLLTTLAEIAGNAIQRMRLHSQTEQHVQRLTALHVVDLALSASLDVRVILGAVLDQLISQLHVDAADILFYKPLTQTLEFTIGRGFRTRAVEKTRLRMDDSQAGQAVLDRRILKIPSTDEGENSDPQTRLLAREEFVEHYTIPLTAKGQIKGVLDIFHRAPLEADRDWLDFVEMLGNQAAIAIDNAELFQRLERSNIELGMAYDATIRGWSHALDLRDKETEGHTQRVTEITEKLARRMGLDDEQLIHLRRGALLHDMGKIGVPDSILLKPDKLTAEELFIMQQHPKIAFEMLSKIKYLQKALDIPYCHHEKWDGTGYPQGLQGEQIPLGARLFTVIDIWDALANDRVYRKAWPNEKTLAYIQSISGTHLDPKVVNVFMEMVNAGELEL